MGNWGMNPLMHIWVPYIRFTKTKSSQLEISYQPQPESPLAPPRRRRFADERGWGGRIDLRVGRRFSSALTFTNPTRLKRFCKPQATIFLLNCCHFIVLGDIAIYLGICGVKSNQFQQIISAQSCLMKNIKKCPFRKFSMKRDNSFIGNFRSDLLKRNMAAFLPNFNKSCLFQSRY
jgi:hypothetical protein